MNHIMLTGERGGEPLNRLYEQRIATEADLREAFAHLRCELLKANREGREVFIELWSEQGKPMPRMASNQRSSQ